MRTYTYTKESRVRSGADKKVTEPARAAVPADPIAEAAYQWNNALLIAAQKLWSHPVPEVTLTEVTPHRVRH